jgi:hypothetical protein
MANLGEFNVLGQDDLISAITETADGAVEAFGRALHEEGSMAFRRTQREVPVRKGYLKNSGRITQPEVNGNGDISVTITYGSSATKYAAAVHDLNKNYRNGRKWRYVADPVQARIPGMADRIIKRITRNLREG